MLNVPPGCLKFKQDLESNCEKQLKDLAVNLANKTDVSSILAELRYIYIFYTKYIHDYLIVSIYYSGKTKFSIILFEFIVKIGVHKLIFETINIK